MREIKFRYVWKRLSDGHIWLEIVPIGCLEGRGDVPFVHKDHSLWELIDVNQFTGFRDKNGVEIYEKTLMQLPGNWFVGVVGMVDGVWQFENLGGSPPLRNKVKEGYVVVGTLCENPELL